MDETKKDFDDVEEIILEFEGYEDFPEIIFSIC